MAGNELPHLEIDYPAEGAVVAAGHYTFRVGSDARLIMAEVSIDRGPWRACRQACGYWWYDWTGGAPGEHTLSARATAHDGRPVNATLRRFVVSGRR